MTFPKKYLKASNLMPRNIFVHAYRGAGAIRSGCAAGKGLHRGWSYTEQVSTHDSPLSPLTCSNVSQHPSEIHVGVIDMFIKNHRAKHDRQYAWRFVKWSVTRHQSQVSIKHAVVMRQRQGQLSAHSVLSCTLETLHTSCSLCCKATYRTSLNTNVYIWKCR